MDFESEKSSVPRLDLGSGLNFDKLDTGNVHETQMWTIPLLTEEYLSDLMKKFPDSVKDIMKKHIIPFISAEKAGIELNNASINVLGPNNQKWKIISGHGKYQINIELMDINDPVITIKANEDKPEEIYCKEITKIFLGKCIIQKCGNEGTKKNESMRKLLQFAIYRLTDEYDKNILKNANVYIYDSMETLILVSGDGRNSFVINSENGNPKLKCVKLEKKNNLSKIKLFGCPWFVLIGFTLILLFPFQFCDMRDSARYILWKIWEWLICLL
ncbi:unnamed protein product [Mytilus coruscus]|uniref:Uncharacterized protein n=1 Tax=Mytilus coruscus TaxID=42192 RepID=A0A6J8AGX2_MYTCO|nr:unnamed protein product [Mytilus coruscus]